MYNLKKIPEKDIVCKSISIYDKMGFIIGKVFLDGGFVPSLKELSLNDLKIVIQIQENFNLFYDNLKEK